MQQHIVFVGAGGAGVSSLVLLCLDLGIKHIVAIDSTASELTKKIEHAGATVIIGHGIYTLQQDDIVIYSDATAQSPEVQAAHTKMLNNRKKIFAPLSYFQFLGELSKYMSTISVAGTHGKSTTTGLLATTLEQHHPEFGLAIVGAPINQRGHRNICIGKQKKDSVRKIVHHILFPKSENIDDEMKKHLFVVEADEFNHHFLHLDTDYACIGNIELDHADVYGNLDTYMKTFLDFAHYVRHNIFVLKDALGITGFLKQYSQDKIHISSSELFTFTHLLGAHNHANASLALSCAKHLCSDTSKIALKKTLSHFQGLRRRGEYLGKNKHGIDVLTDYAHHPSELASTLSAVEESYPGQPITLIFQPHQARRVVEFWDAFIDASKLANTVIIYEIYTARETLSEAKTYPITSKELSEYMPDIHSFDELGTLFASKMQGTYHTAFSDIEICINSTNSGVILVCTAGNLDWDVRKLLKKTT